SLISLRLMLVRSTPAIWSLPDLNHHQRLAILDRLCIVAQNFRDAPRHFSFNFVHHLHSLDNAKRLSLAHRGAFFHIRCRLRRRGAVECADHRTLNQLLIFADDWLSRAIATFSGTRRDMTWRLPGDGGSQPDRVRSWRGDHRRAHELKSPSFLVVDLKFSETIFLHQCKQGFDFAKFHQWETGTARSRKMKASRRLSVRGVPFHPPLRLSRCSLIMCAAARSAKRYPWAPNPIRRASATSAMVE